MISLTSSTQPKNMPKISRPTVMAVLTDTNVRNLSHMNKNQMWKIIEQKRLVEESITFPKTQQKAKTHNSRTLESIDLDTGEKQFFPSLSEATKH